MPKKIPLSLAFAIPFTLQLVGVVGLVGYLSYRSGQNAVKAMAYQLIDETEQRIEQELDHYLSLPHRFNELNIAKVVSGSIDLNNLEQLHRQLITQHQQFPEFTSILFGSSKGEFLTVHRVGKSEVEAGVTEIDPSQDLLVEVGHSDPNDLSRLHLHTLNQKGEMGRYLNTIDNIDVRDRPWYRKAKTTKKAGWSDPFQIGTTNVLTINAYTPFYSSQQLKGVFSVNLSLETLSQFLRTLVLTEEGKVFIVERNGLLIADSEGESFYVSSLPSPHIPQPGKVQFSRKSVHDSSNPVIQAVTEHLEATFGSLEAISSPQKLNLKINNPNTTEEQYFLTVVPYQDDYDLDWIIVTVVPESDFIGEIEANLRQTIALCGLALMGSVGLAWWSSKRITRSLSHLSQASQELATGSYPYYLPPSHIQEVDQLSQSFRKMTHSLEEAATFRDHYEEMLEQEVEKQTFALKEAQHIAQLGSWEFNLITQEVLWSEELYRIYEAEEQAPVPRPDRAIQKIHPDDFAKFEAEIITKMRRHQPWNTDLKVITQKGNIRYLQVIGKPVFNQQGDCIKFMGTVANITIRKELELQLKQVNQELERLAKVDGLTQIPNRRTFDERLQQEWNRALRQSLPISLLLFDIDYFKKYNDYYGHQKGDYCLQKVALIIKNNCQRSEDFPARYGGEEFAIIATGIDTQKAGELAEKIRKAIFIAAIPHETHQTADRVTVSIGVASFFPEETHHWFDLILKSDRALYEAKRLGRNQVTINN